MKTFNIKYNANWHRPKKPMFSTKIKAETEKDAKDLFKKFFPLACLEYINEVYD